MSVFGSRCGGAQGCPFFDQDAMSETQRQRNQGLCRVSAPQAKEPHFPTVHADDWCGSHPSIIMSVQRVMLDAQHEQMQKNASPLAVPGLVRP